jgi:2-desacetyl-2-hydroxyethyl bacteriochlorophyllide A dehydrogenase
VAAVTTTARAFWIVAPGRGEVRDEQVPAPGDREVRVRTRTSGVSAGTERLVFTGGVPPSQYDLMRAPFQAGDFPGPVKYGYAAVGTVDAGPAERLGERVFCLHPHQSAFVVPAAAAVPVPPTVPDQRAALAANMETALNAVWDAAPVPGERIAVVGAGVVGLLTAHLLTRFGFAPVLVDVDAGRATTAAALGIAFAEPDAVAGPFELVVHASGSPAGLVWALERLGFEGRVVELSWYGDREVTLPLGAAFHSRRLKLLSSQVGAIAAPVRGRIDHRGRLVRALALLDDDRLDVLVGETVALERLPGFLRALAGGRHRVLCARVTYDDT